MELIFSVDKSVETCGLPWTPVYCGALFQQARAEIGVLGVCGLALNLNLKVSGFNRLLNPYCLIQQRVRNISRYSVRAA
ncbi:hypothetical protein FB556_0678 [Enteractinococcus coprophilus]|uniref:Uncharacterized protein n=1 Tax=Enteractinococcus coprophilus TaxID=1027633 RepID=A0A543ANS0_9MICC|nr:hypothetical protein FB556_0678 [Enteractinococcus coprophilus]